MPDMKATSASEGPAGTGAPWPWSEAAPRQPASSAREKNERRVVMVAGRILQRRTGNGTVPIHPAGVTFRPSVPGRILSPFTGPGAAPGADRVPCCEEQCRDEHVVLWPPGRCLRL